ncbi:transcription termination factor 4, mitochondrial [Cheilinus undulatus]|uniref:transcription termination factor 4, mitochondrial n=1 Tax=Cheilinus undulatus TaxID=241271 RepID=UPI001BD49FB3|nr:transcription termination factor 4, mitochondrial [Cheilinus undulatus]
MGTRIAARQVFLFSLRGVHSSLARSPLFGTCCLKPLSIRCSLFCSSRSQDTLQSTQHSLSVLTPSSRKQTTELSFHSLLDMGFTDIQAEQICDTVSKIRGGSAARHALSTLTTLLVFGLNPSSVLKLLEKCPELYTLKESMLQQRIDNLRKLGLVEGSLQRVVAYYPLILTVPVKTVKRVVMFLREKCLFTVQQVTDILRESPAVVMENMDQLEYKFQYVYFRMGVKQPQMVKSRLFRFPLEEVRYRHCFLEHRGLYETPDKKGQTIIINPKLESILNINEDSFVADVAMASAEEYDVFKRLMARECQEQELQMGSIDAGSDEEDEDEEAEEAGGKSGYRKRRKK